MAKLTKYRELAVTLLGLEETHFSGPCSHWGFGNIIKKFDTVFKQLQISEITPSELQKMAILGVVYIFRRYLTDFRLGVKICICYIIPVNVFIILMGWAWCF